MSNIAVITLCDSSNKRGTFKRFVIEDNIGESIHLHVDNMRIDFTINEFLEFSEMVRSSLDELNFLKGYRVDSFDEHFLKECAPYLSDLKKIHIKKIRLSELKCIVNIRVRKGLILQRILPITKTPAYLYLNGNGGNFNQYFQFNYHNCSNEERLHSILESIKINGYPCQDEHVIVFNGKNVIRDGQHRAAALAHLYGVDFEIDVQVFDFGINKYDVRIHLRNVRVVFMWVARRVYRRVKHFIKFLG